MKIGPMRERVEWFVVSPATRPDGTPSPGTPVSQGTFWAQVRSVPATGPTGEAVVNKGQELRSETIWKVTMRYVGNVLPQDQLLYEGKTLEITDVFNLEELNLTLVITAKEVRVA